VLHSPISKDPLKIAERIRSILVLSLYKSQSPWMFRLLKNWEPCQWAMCIFVAVPSDISIHLCSQSGWRTWPTLFGGWNLGDIGQVSVSWSYIIVDQLFIYIDFHTASRRKSSCLFLVFTSFHPFPAITGCFQRGLLLRSFIANLSSWQKHSKSCPTFQIYLVVFLCCSHVLSMSRILWGLTHL